MPELDDQQLLRDFADTRSEAAFDTLVARYVNLVYSTALRFASDPQHAEEITQAVFIILARKAGDLRHGVVLSGWLYQTARLTAANVRKSEIRRQRREQEACMQSILNEPDAAAWEEIAPLLDDAMGRLGETDRNAIVLRFFENKTAREVAAALKLTEAAAHKRMNRALDKLRGFFAKRGITSTSAIIAGAISAHSVHAAPVGLAKTISAIAVAKGVAVPISTLTLIKGALKVMAWTKAKTAVVAGTAVLLAAGITTVSVKVIRERVSHPYARQSWQVFDDKVAASIMGTAPPQVSIVPTAFPKGGHIQGNDRPTWSWIRYFTNGAAIGMNCSISDIMRYACSGSSEPFSKQRTVVEPNLTPGGHDFIANVKGDPRTQLRREIENELGIVGTIESRWVNVLALRAGTDRDGLNAGNVLQGSVQVGNGKSMLEATSTGQSMLGLAKALEKLLNFPVVDQTEISNRFNLTLKWTMGNDGSSNALKQVLLDQLGLELVPTNIPIEMLVVEKVKR